MNTDLWECLSPHIDHELTVEGNANWVTLVCHTCNRVIASADQAMTIETDVSPALVSDIAQSLDADGLETFVQALPAGLVPLYLARLLDAATNIRALTVGLETRLILDGQTGQRFTVEGVEYGFFGAQRKGYSDMPGLFRFLHSQGISIATLAEAVSEARVTDLREAADRLTDREKRRAALDEIDSHRVNKGERGTPKFQAITEYGRGG